jgi:hypothetical protein
VKTNVEGAELSVDDVPVAKTPVVGPLVVGAGRRKLTLTKAPAAPVTRYVDVTGGVHESVELSLPTATASTAPPSLASTARPARKRALAPETQPAPTSYAPVWAGVAVTGALTAGALTAGAFALSSQSRLEARLDRAPTDEAGVSGQRDEVRRWSLVTDLAAGAAVLSGGVTVYLYVSRRGERSRQGSVAPPARVGWGPRGLTLSGYF